jgi:DNA-binding MarR family transcriptional regulator
MVTATKNRRQRPDLQGELSRHEPYKFHNQPTHLEHVLNDINEELRTTPHGLKLGPAALLRFLATVAWTSKTNHPEWYGMVHPKHARIGAMAQMIGAGERATRDYLTALYDADFIRREHQDGDRYKIWVRWSDKDRKARRQRFCDIDELDFSFLYTEDRKAKRYDNRYWVNSRTGQFWRHDTASHKVADDEELVELTSEQSRFFWDKSLTTTQRREIMLRLTTPGGHAWLSKWADDFNHRQAPSRRR